MQEYIESVVKAALKALNEIARQRLLKHDAKAQEFETIIAAKARDVE